MSKNQNIISVDSKIGNIIKESWKNNRTVLVTGGSGSGKSLFVKYTLDLFFANKYNDGYDPKKGLTQNARKLSRLLNDDNNTLILTNEGYAYTKTNMPCCVIEKPMHLDDVIKVITEKNVQNLVVENYEFYSSDDLGLAFQAKTLGKFLNWTREKKINLIVVKSSYKNMSTLGSLSSLPSGLTMLADIVLETISLSKEQLIEIKFLKNRYGGILESEFLKIKDYLGN